MNYTYMSLIEDDPDGGFLVTFPDVAEAITGGDSREEAIDNARSGLSLALRGILQEGRDLPQPDAKHGVPIAVDADVAAKLAVIVAFRKAGITTSELAGRLGTTDAEARRILDPDYGSNIALLQDALRALGQEIVVTVRDAA